MSDATTARKPEPTRVLILWNTRHEVPPDAESTTPPHRDAAIRPEGESGAESASTRVLGPMAQSAVVLQIRQALEKAGFWAVAINIEDDLGRLADAVRVERPSLIFNLIDEFDGDTTRYIPVIGYIDLLGVPYTSADPICLATCQDRARTHLLLQDAGVDVPRFAVIRDVNAVPDTDDFRVPLILTQSYDDLYEEEGNERPLYERGELIARAAELSMEFDLPYLIEEYIECRRVHTAVLGNRVLDVLPIVEHTDHADLPPSRPGTPWVLAQLEYRAADRIRELARRAFLAMGCRDIAVVDFHLDDDGNVYVIDVRPVLELGKDAPFHGICAHTERGFAGVISDIARVACQRTGVAEPALPGAPGLTAASAATPPSTVEGSVPITPEGGGATAVSADDVALSADRGEEPPADRGEEPPAPAR